MAAAKSLLAALFAAAPVSRGAESILGAMYGLNDCVGVEDATAWDDLAALGCTVVSGIVDGKPRNFTNAVATSTLKGMCGLRSQITLEDGFPVTFSAPVDDGTLDAEDFKVTLSDGTTVVPSCASLRPANEGNEGNTVGLMGNFGNGVEGTIYPVRVEVMAQLTLLPYAGGSFEAKGLVFEGDMGYVSDVGSRLHMVLARLESFSTDGEGRSLMSGAFPNHCQQLYGASVTHRVQVILNGGGFLDGVRSALPGMRVFDVLAEGSVVGQPHFLGLADLGSKANGSSTDNSDNAYASDGDNFFDLCISDPNAEIVGKIDAVRMPCTDGGVPLYPPKGHFGGAACEPHRIPVARAVPLREPLLV